MLTHGLSDQGANGLPRLSPPYKGQLSLVWRDAAHTPQQEQRCEVPVFTGTTGNLLMAMQVAKPRDEAYVARGSSLAAVPIRRFPCDQIPHASTQHSRDIARQAGGICQLPSAR